MSLISVDFISLAIQIKRLEQYRSFIDEIYDKTEYIFRSIEYMSLGEVEDELRYAINVLQETSELTAINTAKLKKVSELYEECENSIVSAIDDLSCNMPKWDNVVPQYQFCGQALPLDLIRGINTDVFSGHSVINEDWLDELIY